MTAGNESNLTGTAALVRLNLRLDRVRIVVWTLAMGLGVWSSVEAMRFAYPDAAALATRAMLLGNPATIMMTGPAFAIDDYTFGAAIANELSLYVFLAVAIMSVLLTVRHTRTEEESGRLELIRGLPVGRFAPATASVLTVGLANLVVGAATSAGLLGAELEVASSIAFGVATALTGLVFAACATVAGQLTEHARTATGMSMGVVALAYLVRGMGDVINPTGSWLSWLSPFAWAQQTRLYVDLRWWPLLVSLGAAVVLYGLAVALARRRDLGAGLRPTKGGSPTAARTLLSPAGLAQRSLRGSLLAWTIGASFFAVAMGALANELDDMLAATPELGDWIDLAGIDLTAEFAGIILSYVMIAPMILIVGGVLRLRSEEQDGRGEQMIVAGSSRVGYLAGWVGTVVAQTFVLVVACGLGVGLGVWFGTGEPKWVADMLVAALVFLPAVLLIGGVAFALYGALPRLSGLAWLFVVWVSVALMLGELLKLPDWAMDTSPFTHTSLLPAQDVEPVPLLIMIGITVALAAIGFAGLRRRDLASN